MGEKDSDDYAIVSRILDSKTGRSLMIIAGLTHRGTQAAGDFITNPELVAEFIKQAPKDWSRKNLQIVLHTNVVNDVPGSPTVVASYYWQIPRSFFVQIWFIVIDSSPANALQRSNPKSHGELPKTNPPAT